MGARSQTGRRQRAALYPHRIHRHFYTKYCATRNLILTSTFPADNERSPRLPQRLISTNCLKSLASRSGLVDAVMTFAVNMRSKAHAKSKNEFNCGV